jgi:hypothetical protein
VLDLGIGLDVSVNGNVNSGAIGRLQGQAAAILPNPYGEVYGTGLHFKFGGGYVLNQESELRAVFSINRLMPISFGLATSGPRASTGNIRITSR